MQSLLVLFLQLLLFLLLSIVCFYLPGFLVLQRAKKELEDGEFIALAFSLGFIFFLVNLVVWGFLGLRIFVYLPFGLLLLWSLYIYQFDFFKPFVSIFRYKLVVSMLILGILIQGFINFPSGFNYGDGLLFWSSQGHDGIWHIALMEEVKKFFPPQNPLFAGESIYNYHYFVDLIMGEFVRLFPFISSLDFYFRFFPVLLSFLIGVGSFSFVKRWKNNYEMGIWAMFFTMLVGSFGYIVTFLKHGQLLGGETVFWASQNNTILGNPPHAIAFTFIISFLIAFYHYLKKREYFWFGVCLMVGLLLAGFKVSGGFVLLAGLGLATASDLLLNKKYQTALLLVPLSVSNYIVFKLLTHNGESFLIWSPWWFVRTMVVAGNRLDWIDLELKRQFYLDKGGFRGYARVLEYELVAFAIFFVGNLGMRVIGLFSLAQDMLKKRFYHSPVDVLLFGSMMAGFLMPMLFIQKGISYNNIQFIQYFFLITGFYGAVTVVTLLKLVKNTAFKVALAGVIILLAVPTALGNLNEFYGPNTSPLAKVSNKELEALNWMQMNTEKEAVVLVAPYDKYLKDTYDYQPKPIFAWYSTAYVSAIGSRRTYLSSEEQVDITGYPLESRLDPLKGFFASDDPKMQRQFLKSNRIAYIYLAKDEIKKPLNLVEIGLQKAFENEEVLILKVL